MVCGTKLVQQTLYLLVVDGSADDTIEWLLYMLVVGNSADDICVPNVLDRK